MRKWKTSGFGDDLSGEQEGTLSIATTHTQARYVLPDTIREFRERYPRINLELHQGTSEQIAELIAANRVDFAIATGSYQLFPNLVLLPCFRWDRIVLVPKGHPLTRLEKLDLAALAAYPLVTYVFSATGESSLKRLSRNRGSSRTSSSPRATRTSSRPMYAWGWASVSSRRWLSSARTRRTRLPRQRGFSAPGRPAGFRRDSVLRRQGFHRAARALTRLMRKVVQLGTQAEVDELFADTDLHRCGSLRGGSGEA